MWKPSLCFQFGLCVCGHSTSCPNGVSALRLWHKLKPWMQAQFRKHKGEVGPGRELLDSQRAVLCFSPGESLPQSAENPETCPQKVFLHVGYVNRTTWHFAAVCLHTEVEDLLSPELLEALPPHPDVVHVCVKTPAQGADSLGVRTDMQALSEKLDYAFPWAVSVFAISDKEDHWQHADTSSVVVPLTVFQKVESREVWRGMAREEEDRLAALRGQKRKQPAKGGPGRPRRPRAGPSTTNADPAPDDAAASAPEAAPEGVPDAAEGHGLGVYSEHEESEEDDQDDGTDYDNEVAQPSGSSSSDSEMSSSSTSPCNSEDAAQEGGFGDNEQPAAARNRAEAAEKPADLGPDAAEAAEKPADLLAGPDAAEPAGMPELPDQHGERRPVEDRVAGRRADFDKNELDLGPLGRLRFYPHTKVLVAVCPSHGPDCRMQRSVQAHPRARDRSSILGGQGRPLGLLMSWLQAQTEHPTQQEHIHLFSAARGARLEGRATLLLQPGGAGFAAATERPMEEGEEDEPARIK